MSSEDQKTQQLRGMRFTESGVLELFRTGGLDFHGTTDMRRKADTASVSQRLGAAETTTMPPAPCACMHGKVIGLCSIQNHGCGNPLSSRC